MNSKEINVLSFALGEVISEDIYDSRNVLIIPKDTVIDDTTAKHLIRLGIFSVPVYQYRRESAKLSGGKAPDTKETIKQNYVENVETFKGLLNALASGKDLRYEEVEAVSSSILQTLDANYRLLECVNELRGRDEYTYTHSINVALYAMLTAKWLGLRPEAIKEIIEASILHDLGKSKIPDGILNKAGPLQEEEFEQMKKHTIIGYNLSKQVPEINDETRKAVLMHHEREDGKGYPLGVRGDQINLYAKIISVADVYDAITSDRVYKMKKTPFETFKEYEKIGYGCFDTKVMLTFLYNIAYYYLGAKVKMNTGEVGEVAYISRIDISKPIVKVGDAYIDLSEICSYSIAEMI